MNTWSLLLVVARCPMRLVQVLITSIYCAMIVTRKDNVNCVTATGLPVPRGCAVQ